MIHEGDYILVCGNGHAQKIDSYTVDCLPEETPKVCHCGAEWKHFKDILVWTSHGPPYRINYEFTLVEKGKSPESNSDGLIDSDFDVYSVKEVPTYTFYKYPLYLPTLLSFMR